MATTDIQSMGDELKMSLSHFVLSFPLPQRAKVMVGYMDPSNEDIDFSTGDVIEIVRVLCPFIGLTFADPTTRRPVHLSVSTRNPTRFRLESDPRHPVHVFRSVAEVIEAWPYAIRTVLVPSNGRGGAGALSVQPVGLKHGAVLRLVKLERAIGDQCAVLVCHVTSTSELVRLPVNNHTGGCCFEEIVDRSRLYTLGELAQLARVRRVLQLFASDQQRTCEADRAGGGKGSRPGAPPFIPGMPPDFSGRVDMEEPRYLVEIKQVAGQSEWPGEDDEGASEDGDDDDEHKVESFLVPIDTELCVSVRSSDYEPADMDLNTSRLFLSNFGTPGWYFEPQIVRVVSAEFDQVSAVLENNLIRSGDQLIIYRKTVVRKLAANVNAKRCYFIPVGHPGPFRVLENTNSRSPGSPPTTLRNILLSIQSRFPLLIEYVENKAGKDASDVTADRDPSLPVGVPICVEGELDDEAVVASKIFGNVIGRPFHVPLRTRLAISLVARWTRGDEKGRLSDRDGFAEVVDVQTYENALERGGAAAASTAVHPVNTTANYEQKSTSNREPTTRKITKPQPATPASKPRPNISTHRPTSQSGSSTATSVVQQPRPVAPPVPLPKSSKLPPIVKPPSAAGPPLPVARTLSSSDQRRSSQSSQAPTPPPIPPASMRQRSSSVQEPAARVTSAATKSPSSKDVNCDLVALPELPSSAAVVAPSDRVGRGSGTAAPTLPVAPARKSTDRICGTATVFRAADQAATVVVEQPQPKPPPGQEKASGKPNSNFDSFLESEDTNYDDYEEINDGGFIYAYVDVDEILKNAGRIVAGQQLTISIPADGNVSRFTSQQMLLLMNQMGAPPETLRVWNSSGVDGRRFAEMSNKELAALRLLKPLIIYFRDHSRSRR